MALTSKLGTGESTLANEMVAGQLNAMDFNENVSHNMSMGHVVDVQIVYGLSHAMTLAHVASFSKDPTPPNIPLVIIDGKVQRNNSTLDEGGRITRFIGSNYTQVFEDRVLIATAPLTVDLLPASQFPYRELTIKSRAAGTVTIDPNGTETIDDDLTKTITVINDSLALISDGLQWYTIGGGGGGSGSQFLDITNTDLTDANFYYYGGTDAGGAWVINRYNKPGGGGKVTANEGNNPSHTTLATAWSVRNSLTYV